MQPEENQKGKLTPNPTEETAEKNLADLLRNPTGEVSEKKPEWPVRKTEAPADRVPIKSLRTYQGDVEEAMAKNKSSVATVFVAEQKRKIEKPPEPRAVRKPINVEARNKLFTVVGITLLFFGVLTVVAVYYVRSNEKVVIEQQTKAIIDFSSETQIMVGSSTRTVFIDRLVSEKNKFDEPVNSVLFINTLRAEESRETIEKIAELLAPNMPPSLARSFEEEYMFGVLSYSTNELFIVLRTKDYPSAYAGMLKWEKDMKNDLGKMFDIPQNTATTSHIFVDEAIRNKDLRVLKDGSSKTTLVYSFIDKNTLVITKNEEIFNALLAKYLTSQNTR